MWNEHGRWLHINRRRNFYYAIRRPLCAFASALSSALTCSAKFSDNPKPTTKPYHKTFTHHNSIFKRSKNKKIKRKKVNSAAESRSAIVQSRRQGFVLKPWCAIAKIKPLNIFFTSGHSASAKSSEKQNAKYFFWRTTGFEPAHNGATIQRLTTWPRPPLKNELKFCSGLRAPTLFLFAHLSLCYKFSEF